MLSALVFIYLLSTIAIGLCTAKWVKNTTDFAIAGRQLPLYMTVATTFATWFSSEAVLSIMPGTWIGSLASQWRSSHLGVQPDSGGHGLQTHVALTP